nr:ArlX3 [Gefionella okellyi]
MGGCSSSASFPTIALFGLDGSGKTALLHHLATNKCTSPAPTDTPSAVTTSLPGGQGLNVRDVPGHYRFRTQWLQHLRNCTGVLFVVDSTDSLRLPVAQAELHKLATSGKLSGQPLVIAANKQDLPTAMSVEELSTALELHALPVTHWYVMPCSALDGSGVRDLFKRAADRHSSMDITRAAARRAGWSADVDARKRTGPKFSLVTM